MQNGACCARQVSLAPGEGAGSRLQEAWAAAELVMIMLSLAEITFSPVES